MTENLWKTLSSINDWVRFSEGKAIALLAAQGVMIGVISQNHLNTLNEVSGLGVFLSSIALILNGGSMLFAFFCLNPRLKFSGVPSPIYFGSIATNFDSAEEYYEYFENNMSDTKSISGEISRQIHANSHVAYNKFKDVAFSIRFFVGSLGFWFVFIFKEVIF